MPSYDSNTKLRIRINNWNKWQRQIKGRRRDWVAISCDLLHDPQFFNLTVESRYLWICLLLHAGRVGVPSECGSSDAGVVFECSPSDARVLFKLRRSADFEPLQNQGFIDFEVATRQDITRHDKKPSVSLARNVPKGDSYSDEFERFWSHYPNKKGKRRAYASWKSQRLDQHVVSLIEHVNQRKQIDRQWIRDGGQFIPHGSTFIVGRRWEDNYAIDVDKAPRSIAGHEALLSKYGGQT